MNKWAKAVVMDDSISVWSSDVMTYNGTSTYAQSDDVVAKTAYDGTVSGNVTIGSDSDWNYINFVWSGSGLLTHAVSPSVWVGKSFTIIMKIKTGSDITTLQRILLNWNWTADRTGISIHAGEIKTWVYNGSFISPKSIAVVANTLYTITYKFDWTNWTLIVNDITATWTNTPWTANITALHIWGDSNFYTWYIYYTRIYSTALTDSQRTTELALWQKQTARKDCVLEILPDYFALPASPTTVYDSVGNNNGTVTWALAVTDNSFVFDGTAKYITLTTPQTFAWECTICGWFNYTGGSTLTKMFLWNNLWAGTRAKIWNINNGKLFVRVIDWWSSTSLLNMPTGDFFFCMTRNSSNKIDVTLNTTKTRIFSDVAQVGNIAYDIIGKDDSASYWQGNVYGVSFYNRAITDSEVTEIYNAWRNVRTPVTSWLISEYRPSPTTIYDVKAFTPATPVIIKTTARRVWTAGTDDVIIAPYWKIQATSSQFNTFITQTTDKTSVYSITDELNHNIVCAFYFSNWSYNTKLFVDWVLRDSDTWSTGALTKLLDYIQISWWTNFFAWTISNTKVYIWKITDAEGVLMSSWIDITPVWATLFTAPKKMSDTTMIDTSPNDYDFTITP